MTERTESGLAAPAGEIAGVLLTWYGVNKRDLPWRKEVTPYRTWLSEIMLQQTRVEAVKPYFERFLRVCPDVGSLAEIEDGALLKLWEGLGYYSRARNLKKAAVIVTEKYGGTLPDDPAELRKLPGIGSYTAGAIASIAYGKRAPAVDGNVLRVLSRLTGSERDVTLPETKKWAEAIAYRLCPEENAGDFTQSLIELGATVCLPGGEAKCPLCPLRSFCEAKKKNAVAALPVRAPKKPRKIEEKTVLLLKDGDRFRIGRRKEKGLLAGLYEFPNFDGVLSVDEAVAKARDLGFEPIRAEALPPALHIFTHKEWHMTGWLMTGYSEDAEAEAADYEALRTVYAIPSAFSAYMKRIEASALKEHPERK